MNPFRNLKADPGGMILRAIIILPLSFLVIVFIYGIMTFLGGIIPVNKGRRVPAEGETIYLADNGYHVALALPRDSCPYADIFDNPLNLSGKGGFFYFGWGDRKFYLGTPTVRNIDWSMALGALFIPSPVVLEVLYIHKFLPDQPEVTPLLVTEDELSDLYQYIKESIMGPQRVPEQILPDEIDQAFQGSIFFEARGSYSLFYTCNNWTSRGLKQAGIGTHLWTPFTWGVKY